MTHQVLEPFRVEKWMDEYEVTARFNIAETCATSISIDDVCTWAGVGPGAIFPPSRRLVYGSIRGSDALRKNLAAIYNNDSNNNNSATPVSGRGLLKENNFLITNGAIGANFAVFYSLIGKGDHVICHHPTYQQLYSVPKSLGARVDLWRTSAEDGWELDLDQLKKMIRSETKMVVLNNPQNPTGKVITKSVFESVIEIAREHGLYVFVDEVYRPLFHGILPSDPEYPPPAVHWDYDRIVSTGSMSKAYSLAGIRVGWIVSRSLEIVEACAEARDYTMISVSQLDDQLATIAMGSDCNQKIIERNIKLAQKNLAILDDFVQNHVGKCEYVKSRAGTTAFIRFFRDGKPVDDVAFCKAAHAYGAFMVPGNHCFADGADFRGYVRIGYVCATEELEAGLKALEDFIQKEYESLPLAV